MKTHKTLLRLITALCLYSLYAIPLYAQYYIDAYNKGGLKYSYITTNIDSLVFGGTEADNYYMTVYPKLYYEVKYLVSELDSVQLSPVPVNESHKYVDLGLSVNWATCNVGAYRPEDYGNYYSWGEIEIKKDYGIGHYKFGRYSTNSVTKYCLHSSVGLNGFVDNKSTLDLEDDVAHVEWGDHWRIPLLEEVQELIDNCNWILTIRNGVKGYEVKSKIEGYTDNSIFIPFAGTRNERILQAAGSNSSYTIGTLLNTRDCWRLNINSGRVYLQEDNRIYGLPVRPVWSKEKPFDITSIAFDSDQVEIMLGRTLHLNATAYSDDSIVDVKYGWSTSNPNVVTVDSTGLITAISIGECVIKAEYKNLEAQCTIKVVEPYVEAGLTVTLNKDSLIMIVEDKETLKAIVRDSVGNEVNYNIPWKTNDSNIADIDSTGIVTAVSVGSTIIYIPCKDTIVSCFVQVIGKKEWVNLGLSVNWATFNVGADEPEGYGEYYTWGGLTPISSSYCPEYVPPTLSYDGEITVLDPAFDVVRVKWGGEWRMPTNEEFEELRNNCNWIWTSINGHYGYKVASKLQGFTDNYIFLPASGSYQGNELKEVNSRTYYRTNVYYPLYQGGYTYSINSTLGYNQLVPIIPNVGVVIRPVTPSNNGTIIASIELDKNFSNLEFNQTLQLTAQIKSTLGKIDTTAIWKTSDVNIATVTATGLVTAQKNGRCIITAECGGVTAECHVIVVSYEEPDYVDLGLSVLWATSNIGADTPEDYGYYYAWGETETKDNYTSYKWSTGSYNSSLFKLTKYCNDSSWGVAGTTDTIVQLETDDDIAYTKLGDKWRIPSKADFEELLANCTVTTVISSTGQNGCVFTSNIPGYTDRSIFLPFAGWKYDDTSINSGASCFYISRSLDEDLPISAWCLYLTPEERKLKTVVRYDGYVIRPVRIKEELPTPEYVDLGLSVKWATFNVGAKSPEDYGGYYAWGETKEKKDYSWATYKHCKGTNNTFTSYCINGSLGYLGLMYLKITLVPDDDVAHILWGGDWRMPTYEEFMELIYNCNWEEEYLNGVLGLKFTSRVEGHKDKSIFLPLSGQKNGKEDVKFTETIGFYWSSSLYMNNNVDASYIGVKIENNVFDSFSERCNGLTVRPVCP